MKRLGRPQPSPRPRALVAGGVTCPRAGRTSTVPAQPGLGEVGGGRLCSGSSPTEGTKAFPPDGLAGVLRDPGVCYQPCLRANTPISVQPEWGFLGCSCKSSHLCVVPRGFR